MNLLDTTVANSTAATKGILIVVAKEVPSTPLTSTCTITLSFVWFVLFTHKKLRTNFPSCRDTQIKPKEVAATISCVFVLFLAVWKYISKCWCETCARRGQVRLVPAAARGTATLVSTSDSRNSSSKFRRCQPAALRSVLCCENLKL